MNKPSYQHPELSPIKKLLFGFIFFCLILLMFEFLLSFAGLEKHDSKFMPKSSYPIFVPGKGDMSDYYVTSPHFGAYINSQSFLREKPADLTRIFVIGGSAAYGFPYTEEYGFSGYLRRALDKAVQGNFEVINVSGMSFGSHRVLDVLKDVVLHEPDLVIIYSGNNEYVEQNILPETKTPPAALEKISSLLDRTDIYRAIRLGLFKVIPKVFETRMKQDITDIRSNPRVSRGDIGRSSHTDSTILANYRNNINAMKDLLVQQGVKVILVTVPVDIGGWLPKSGLPQFANEDAAQKWIELVDLRDKAFNSGDLAQEAEYMQKILKITPNDPGMRFNLGKVLWMLGKYETSYQELVKAKDLDYRPTRALSSFNEVVRSNVDESNGVYLADLDGIVKEKYMQGQAKGIFLDYCHLTETGNKLAAQWLLPIIDKALQSAQLDINLLPELIIKDPRAETKLGHIYADKNELKKAADMYNKALQLNPKNHKSLLALGYISLHEGKLDQAENSFEKAIKVSTILPGAYAGLGDVAMRRGKFQQAVKYYNDSLRLGQDSVWLRKSLAHAYLSLGDNENAVRNWKIALKYNPFDQETRTLVEKYSAK
jgi:tetratricopeptide (TPR) repeat protein